MNLRLDKSRTLRAGLYERVSTEEQSMRGYSIDAQIENLEEYCKINKIKIVDHYTDEGLSGAKPPLKRPALRQLLEDVQAGKIDIILFTKLDRWFRSVQEYFKVQEILEEYGVEWRAIHEDYDTTTANGRMAITIFMAIAQNEREKTAERIKTVFEHKRRNKEAFFGITSIPYGYKEEYDEDGIRRLVKDPELEDAVQDFWDLAVKYENVNYAAKEVTLKYGLERKLNKWDGTSKKEIYTGTYKGVEDYCPAYVSRSDWEKLQNRNGRIKKTSKNRIYLFTQMIKCPNCGRRMASYYTYLTCKNGEYKEYHRYRCQYKDRLQCDNAATLSEMKIEKWLLKNIDDLMKEEIAKVEIAKTKPKPKAKTNIAVLKERMRKLEVIYLAGNKTDEEYIQEQAELKAAITKAEKELPEDLADKDLTTIKNMLETDVRSIYKTLDAKDRRRFWRTLIKQIYVQGNLPVSVDFH